MVQDTVAVAVCTFGDREIWDAFADRAINSIHNQTRLPDEIIRIHGESLYQARNEAAKSAHSKFIAYVDADDEFELNYLASMLNCAGDVRVPKVRQVLPNGIIGPDEAKQPTNLLEGNWVVIGAMVERERILKLGGFRDLPANEDQDLWIRFWLDGARFVQSEAVYIAHYRKGSRNQISKAESTRLYYELYNTYKPIAIARKLI